MWGTRNLSLGAHDPPLWQPGLRLLDLPGCGLGRGAEAVSAGEVVAEHWKYMHIFMDSNGANEWWP